MKKKITGFHNLHCVQPSMKARPFRENSKNGFVKTKYWNRKKIFSNWNSGKRSDKNTSIGKAAGQKNMEVHLLIFEIDATEKENRYLERGINNLHKYISLVVTWIEKKGEGVEEGGKIFAVTIIRIFQKNDVKIFVKNLMLFCCA